MIDMIENILKYYYNLTDFKIKKKNDSYIINSNQNIFYFCPVLMSKDELYSIVALFKELSQYDSSVSTIILNKGKSFTTSFNNYNYLMLKIGKNNIDSGKFINYNKKQYISLYRNSWDKLWSAKIDYLEFQRIHIKGEHKYLDKYFDFFVGLTECAIALFNNISYSLDDKKIITIQHKRYNNFFYDDPNNIIIDYSVRDVAELIKFKYFNDKLDYNELNTVISNLNYDDNELKLLFSRLLYPSLYFDLYSDIINNNVKDKDNIDLYIDKFDNYYLFLKKASDLPVFNNIKNDLKWLK